MPKKHFLVEQIISHLREAEVFLAQGQTIGQVCRHIGISEQSYYRWRREYGGGKVDQACEPMCLCLAFKFPDKSYLIPLRRVPSMEGRSVSKFKDC